MEFEINVIGGRALIFTPYNKEFVDRVKLMGARWNPTVRCWTINEQDVDEVRKLMQDVYGRDDRPVSETVDVELTFTTEVSCRHEPVTILGRTISSASGRDSGARIGNDVLFLKGSPQSGGSVKNWHSIVPEGSVVKLVRLPKSAVQEQSLPDGVTMRVLSNCVDREALLAEKTKLLARLAEIEDILNQSDC